MKRYAFWIVLALTAITCGYAFFNFLLPLDVFAWDESHHGFYAMQIFDDLSLGDWESFWAHTNNQALWMPLHSWLVGAFLYFFGFSFTTARCASLFLFFLSALLVYLISAELSEERGWLIGLIAVVLCLTSPALLHLAVLNMQEMLGMFICLLAVYFMVRHQRHKAAWKYLVLGFLLGIAYWAKTNYAMVLAFGFGLFQLSLLWDLTRPSPALPAENQSAGGKKHKKKKPQPAANALKVWFMDNFYIILGFLPLFILWWATPPFERKYGLGVTIRQGSVAGSALSFLSGILPTAAMYTQSFLSSYNISCWIALGCLSSLIWSWRYFRDRNIRLLSIVCSANFIFLSLLTWNEERFLSLTVPLCFILFGYFNLTLYERLRRQTKYYLLLIFFLLIFAASFVYDLTQLTRFTKEMANKSISSFLYKDSLNHYTPPFIFGFASRPAFTFPTGIQLKGKKYPDFPAAPSSNIRDILDYFRSRIDRARSISTLISGTCLSPYVFYWYFHDWSAPVLTANDLMYNRQFFWSAEYFLALDIDKGTPYAIDLGEEGWPAAENTLLNGGYIKLVDSRCFPDLGITAKIFKRIKDF